MKKMKKGLTLVELIVAMAIFLTVITLAVGAFVTISRMKSLTSTMKETQQKTRIAMEMITRLSKQAEKIIVSNEGKTLELYFDTKNPAEATGAKFEINGISLFYSTCSGNLFCTVNNLWSDQKDLYSGIEIQADSKFEKIGTIPPQLSVEIHGKIVNGNSNYFSDDINMETTIILEGIK